MKSYLVAAVTALFFLTCSNAFSQGFPLEFRGGGIVTYKTRACLFETGGFRSVRTQGQKAYFDVSYKPLEVNSLINNIGERFGFHQHFDDYSFNHLNCDRRARTCFPLVVGNPDEDTLQCRYFPAGECDGSTAFPTAKMRLLNGTTKNATGEINVTKPSIRIVGRIQNFGRRTNCTVTFDAILTKRSDPPPLGTLN